jgi:hypothetical protein
MLATLRTRLLRLAIICCIPFLLVVLLLTIDFLRLTRTLIICHPTVILFRILRVDSFVFELLDLMFTYACRPFGCAVGGDDAHTGIQRRTQEEGIAERIIVIS